MTLLWLHRPQTSCSAKAGLRVRKNMMK
jgi:hypothetical protein